jgi:hypothetical protein
VELRTAIAVKRLGALERLEPLELLERARVSNVLNGAQRLNSAHDELVEPLNDLNNFRPTHASGLAALVYYHEHGFSPNHDHGYSLNVLNGALVLGAESKERG